MCIMIMKKAISEAFGDLMSRNTTTAKKFLEKIEQRVVKNKKTEIGTLLTSPISIRYKSKDIGKKRNKHREVVDTVPPKK